MIVWDGANWRDPAAGGVFLGGGSGNFLDGIWSSRLPRAALQ